MNDRKHWRRATTSVSLGLVTLMATFNGALAAKLKIERPAQNAKVGNQVGITVLMKAPIASCQVYVDSTKIGGSSSGRLYQLTADLSGTRAGRHVILVRGYNAANQEVATKTRGIRRFVSPTPTPTAIVGKTPTRTPSPTPTPPKPSPTTTPTATMSPTATLTPAGGTTFYVAPAGSDSNTGLARTSPWKTIQHAANTLQAGDTAVVTAGTYAERVEVSRSGSPSNPIILEADAGAIVVTRGFDITASYVDITGFEITTQANDTTGYGIYVTGNGTTGVVIQNNTVHDLCREGIFLDPDVSNLLIRNNLIYRAAMAGIMIEGTGTTVESNEVWGTQQYPRLAGGVTGACSDQAGADADAIRFFGSNHVIKNNYLHDIQFGTTINPDPHTDCFQTWGIYSGSGGSTSNILITGNRCAWPSTSDNTDNEISAIEALNGSITSGITYSYNVFSDMRNGVVIGPGVGTVVFDHNTVDHILDEAGLQFPGATTPASAITNDIFYDCGGGGDSYATGSGFGASNNDCIMRGGADCGTYPSNYSHASVDPQFVSDGSGATPWFSADYHLESSSTAQSMGACGTDMTVSCPPPQ